MKSKDLSNKFSENTVTFLYTVLKFLLHSVFSVGCETFYLIFYHFNKCPVFWFFELDNFSGTFYSFWFSHDLALLE